MQIPRADEKRRDSSNFVAAEVAGAYGDDALALLDPRSSCHGIDHPRPHLTRVSFGRGLRGQGPSRKTSRRAQPTIT